MASLGITGAIDTASQPSATIRVSASISRKVTASRTTVSHQTIPAAHNQTLIDPRPSTNEQIKEHALLVSRVTDGTLADDTFNG